VLHLVAELVQGDGDEQPPEVAAALQVVATVAGGDEEAAVSRLHHVLGIHPLPHLG